MPELTLYTNPNVAYVPRLDLQTVGRSLDTMEQNHLKTIELEGELEAEVNAMELDESENAYKAGLIDNIKASVDSATINGYSGNALSNIIKEKGNIYNNPLLLGKIKANAAHKQYIADTQARTDITQDTKDMFIENNPYDQYAKYIDETNPDFDPSKYKEAGTYTWQAKTTAVRDVPITEILTEGFKFASPEISNWDTIIYQNSDGSTSSTIGPNTIGYIDSSGRITKLSKEKLLDGVKAVINGNQEYRASLNQAFEVQKWKLKNGRIPKEAYEAGVVPGVDKSGAPTSLDEYIKASIDPFLRAKMYEYKEINKKYNPFTAKQIASLSGSYGNGNSSLLGYANGNGRNVAGNNISIRDDQFLTDNLVGTIKLAGDVRNRLITPVEEGGFGISNTDLGLSNDSIGIPADYKIVENAVMKSRGAKDVNELSDADKQFLNQTKSDYLLYAATIDDYNNATSGNDAGAAWRFITPLIEHGQDISQFATSKNPYVKQVVNARNRAIANAFYDQTTHKMVDSIRMSYDNQDDLNAALAKFGGIDSAVALGFKVSGNDIILNYEDRRLIENFAKLVTPDSKGHFYREGDDERVDYKGFRTAAHNIIMTPDVINTKKYKTKGQLYKEFTEASQVLSSLPIADSYNSAANKEQYVTSTSAVPGDTIGSYTLNMLLENPELGKDSRNAYNNAKKASEANTFALLQNQGLSDIGMWRFDEKTNKYEYVDDLAFEGKTPNYSKALNEKLRIQKLIRQTPQKNISFDLFWIDGAGWRPGLRIYSGQPEMYETSTGTSKQQTIKVLENVIFDLPDGIGDSGLDYLNNDTYTKGSTDVISALYRNVPVTIGMDYSGNYGARYNKDKNLWYLTINGESYNDNIGFSTPQITNFRQAYRAACAEIPYIRQVYQNLVAANPNEDINKLKTAAYVEGLVKKHPQVNWNNVDPSMLEYILFEY